MRIASTSVLLTLAACAAVPRVGAPTNQLGPPPAAADRINWPERYGPDRSGFFVHNEVDIAAPPEVVWAELVDAHTWPDWSEGAADVRLATGGSLTADAEFAWRTMDQSFVSVVKEFVPPYRLGWESYRSDLQGYHAWLIVPTATGCRVVTEESQFGFLTFMQKVFVPTKLANLHDRWLAALKHRAEARR
jgi:uncharacterized protein YndB with AHSA1/START domain